MTQVLATYTRCLKKSGYLPFFFTIKYYNLCFFFSFLFFSFFCLGRREVLGFASPPNKKEETHKTPTEPDLICLED